MSAVLHKGASGTAREATLALVMPVHSATPPQPDERDAAITRLEAECVDLRRQLAAAERRRDEELAELKRQAKQAAAEEFHQDDARRLELLAATLNQSLEVFQRELITQSRELAPRLARQALERLVQVDDTEAKWLARAIERRLDDLASQAVVGIQVAASDWSDALIAQLRGRLAEGTALSCDASLPAGTARIGLRLGEVTIDPDAGIAQLLRALGEGIADD